MGYYKFSKYNMNYVMSGWSEAGTSGYTYNSSLGTFATSGTKKTDYRNLENTYSTSTYIRSRGKVIHWYQLVSDDGCETINPGDHETTMCCATYKIRERHYSGTKTTFVEEIIADESSYPINGEKNGFWYVRGEQVRPTIPTMTHPITDETISTNDIYDITWTPSTDEMSGSINYELDISINGGSSWASLYIGAAAEFTYDFSNQVASENAQLRVRAKNTSSNEYSEYSTISFNIVNKVRLGTMKMNGIEIPLYDPSIGMDNKNAFRLYNGSQVVCFELVETSATNASPLRIQTNDGIKAIAKV